MKIKNLRVTSGLMSIIIAGSVSVGNVSNVYAEATYAPTTVIEEKVDKKSPGFLEYTVVAGDNASVISRKITREFGEKPSTEFWPVIAFLNEYPRIINPGDVLIYPSTYERLVEFNSELKAIGWTKRYIQDNNIYHTTKEIKVPRDRIEGLLNKIYGEDVCIDEDFINNYLDVVGFNDKYPNGVTEVDNEVFFDLVGRWIPTLEELGYKKQERIK